MHSQPLVTVKKASMLLGVDKELLREKLKDGAIKGERRRVGNKDRWFMNSGELDFLMNTERLAEVLGHKQRTTLDGLADFFRPEDEEPQLERNSQENESNAAAPVKPKGARKYAKSIKAGGDNGPRSASVDSVDARINVKETRAERGEVFAEVVETIEAAASDVEQPGEKLVPAGYLHAATIDEMMHSLTVEFAYRLAEERQLIYRLESELSEKSVLADKVKPLEHALQSEIRSACIKDLRIKNLQDDLAMLTAKLSQKPKPWWQKLFGESKG